MSKDKKSMDEVLASIRKIIRTDPNARAPDASTLPPGMGLPDETAKAVLEKLRKGRGQADDEEDEVRQPLSKSDDPEETAQAVLAALRRQAEAEKAAEKAADKAAARAAAKPRRTTAAPDLGTPLRTPPEPSTDADDVPELDDVPDLDALETADSLVLNEDDDARRPPEQTRPEPQTGEIVEPDQRPAAAEPALPARATAGRPAPEPPVMIDEAAMEAMIRRVVRDELMGEMGRRMTRNVQKMIKDEIARSRIEKK